MNLTRGISTVGVVLTVSYLLFTGYAIYESVTCPEMVCSLIAVVPILPWTPLFNFLATGPISFFLVYALVVIIDLFIIYLIGSFIETYVKEHLASTRDEGPAPR